MQKGNVLIFLLVGVLILAAIGGAFYLGKSTIAKPSPVPVVTSQTPQPAATLTPPASSSIPANQTIETANWKTYTNSQSGYSLQYPTNWFLAGEKEVERVLIESLKGISSSETSNPMADEESNGFMWVDIRNNKSGLTLKSWFDKNETCGTTQTGCAPSSPKFSEQTTNYEKEAIIADWELPGPLGEGIKVYYFAHGKNIYELSFFYPTNVKNKKAFDDTYNKILSTFKFTR